MSGFCKWNKFRNCLKADASTFHHNDQTWRGVAAEWVRLLKLFFTPYFVVNKLKLMTFWPSTSCETTRVIQNKSQSGIIEFEVALSRSDETFVINRKYCEIYLIKALSQKQISPMGDSATLINQTSYQGVWLRPSLKSQVTNNLPLLRLQWHCTRRTLESITWCWLWENIGRVAMLRSPLPMTNKSCQAGEVSPWVVSCGDSLARVPTYMEG